MRVYTRTFYRGGRYDIVNTAVIEGALYNNVYYIAQVPVMLSRTDTPDRRDRPRRRPLTMAHYYKHDRAVTQYTGMRNRRKKM